MSGLRSAVHFLSRPSAIAKRLSRQQLISGLVVKLAIAYLWFVRWSGRWRIENAEPFISQVAAGDPVIVCFWHGRIILMPRLRGLPVKVVVSAHRDGMQAARVMRYRASDMIVGSTTRGGAVALIEVVRTVRQGTPVAFTPDGPRGPRMRAAAGAVIAAKRSGAPLVPVSGSVSRRRVLNSWDSFVLPLPFARGIIRFGAPIHVPSDANTDEVERARQQLEDAMNALTRELDSELGVAPVEPARLAGSAV